MSTATQVRGLSVDLANYLETTYRPDCEYVDGELRERNVGKFEHARLQSLLAGWLINHEGEWGIISCTKQRVRISRTRVRVPDLVAILPGPQPEVLVDQPLLVIEILSPDDSYADTQERAEDYRTMGVETVWIIDPKTRSGRMCVGTDWMAAKRLVVAGTPVYVELNELFAKLTPAE